MITTIKINKEIKIQECERNGIKIHIKLKNEHKIIYLKLTEREIELLYYIINIIMKNQN